MKTSLNATSFASLRACLSIIGAMRHVLETGEAQRLTNRNGRPYLLVTIERDELGYRFAFFDTAGNEQGSNVLRAAINHWSDPDANAFWSLNAQAYDLAEHPFVTVSRKAQEQIRKETNLRNLHKELGVTHTAHSWGGAVFYAAYQRNWLGRKVMYVLKAGSCEFVKATKEFLACIRHVEAY